MCRPVFIGVVLGCAVSFAAAPKAKPEQAKKYLDAAIRLYNAFEFERALEQLGKARALSQGAELDVAIALYEGVLQLELGRDELGEAAFKTALSLDPNASLPAKVSPKVKQLFDQLKTEMSKPLPPPVKEELKPPPPVEPPPVTPPPPVETARRAQPGPPFWWWMPAVAGAVAAGTGTVFLFQAKDRSDKLRTGPDVDLATAEAYRSQGKTFQTVGLVTIGLGLALVLASALVFLLVKS